MEKAFYNADSLSRALAALEERWGISSDEFYEAHRADADAVAPIPGFTRHVWASIYLDVRRLSGGGFVERVERTLQLA